MKFGKYSKYINFMQKAVTMGAKIVKQTKTLRLIDKGEFDIVTNVDLEIERSILKLAKKLIPKIPIISEESCANNCLPKTCFVIDPVDGTKNFSHGLPLWGIQMAYLEDGEAVASVLYCPEIKVKVMSAKGYGTYTNGKQMLLEPKNLDHSLVYVDGPQNLRWRVAEFLDRRVQGVRLVGSTCVGFSMVSSGMLDGYIYMCNHPWDLLPGLCASRNSGLYVFDNDGKMAIVANSPRLLEFLKTVVLEHMKKQP